MKSIWLVLVYVLLHTHSPVAQAGNRIALVIGNDSYHNVGQLQNARTDARSMAQALENAGFKVTLKLDTDERTFKAALRDFKANVNGGDEAVFYYSGHGVQLSSANYLLPVDIHGENENQVKDEAISLQRVLDDLQDQKARFAMAIIDACRNNPFKNAGRTLGGRGLAPTTAATGQMVIFSAGTGQQALDRLGNNDRSPNGLFTRTFLKEMSKPGVPIYELVQSVRNKVVQQAQSVGHEQVPALYDQALGEFYFIPGTQQSNRELITVQAAPRIQSSEEIEQVYWDSIKDSRSKSDFEDYIIQYPKGRFVALAKMKLKTLTVTTAPQREASATASAPAGSGTFKDCAYCPEMVNIPGKNLAMGKYEVTQGQWKAIMGNNPSMFMKCGDNCPVENVSWNDAQDFIQKLNSKTGKQYRMPTREEWGYACDGGTTHEYCGSDNLDTVAWYSENSGQTSHPVGQKQANGYGLYDMSGNVWEWTQDCNDGCSLRVARGGAWSHIPLLARPAYRGFNKPATVLNNTGFRLARTN